MFVSLSLKTFYQFFQKLIITMFVSLSLKLVFKVKDEKELTLVRNYKSRRKFFDYKVVLHITF